jgi:hypothetical protein
MQQFLPFPVFFPFSYLPYFLSSGSEIHEFPVLVWLSQPNQEGEIEEDKM